MRVLARSQASDAKALFPPQADTVDASTLEREAVGSTEASVDDLMVGVLTCRTVLSR